jgi:hypothetical protein
MAGNACMLKSPAATLSGNPIHDEHAMRRRRLFSEAAVINVADPAERDADRQIHKDLSRIRHGPLLAPRR